MGICGHTLHLAHLQTPRFCLTGKNRSLITWVSNAMFEDPTGLQTPGVSAAFENRGLLLSFMIIYPMLKPCGISGALPKHLTGLQKTWISVALDEHLTVLQTPWVSVALHEYLTDFHLTVLETPWVPVVLLGHLTIRLTPRVSVALLEQQTDLQTPLGSIALLEHLPTFQHQRYRVPYLSI